MPSMTEDLGRIAGGIAASRRERMEANIERHREAGNRHREVGERLHEITTTRETMGREQRSEAAAGRRSRAVDVEALLRLFHHKREENAAVERARAAAFMRDLTGKVASLRDAFRASQAARAKSRHDLAKALRAELAASHQDRHNASAAWRGKLVRRAAPPSPVSAYRSSMGLDTAKAETFHGEPAVAGPAAPPLSPSEPSSRSGRYRASQTTPGDDTGTP